MSVSIYNIAKLILNIVLTLTIMACITVTENHITKKKSPEKAVENYTKLSMDYLERNHPNLASKHIEKALSINNKYTPANDVINLLWQTKGEFDLAEEFFKKAMS